MSLVPHSLVNDYDTRGSVWWHAAFHEVLIEAGMQIHAFRPADEPTLFATARQPVTPHRPASDPSDVRQRGHGFSTGSTCCLPGAGE
ncbi:hypothetical protein QRX50_20825 [Amycolatopsis carbonis]|uniref:Uncharacterized protein n=1 Tax=Amycolatopsis carbonis TaxID=715471 RepID=A0A9Y2IQQ3_9PSEU|nr:hypothetical protein [Amycolatopsis sp. 2-15]WIX83028.1 hypothetical protein QRX50_20825 [Amycolatopsis sp. 2-15]